MLVLILFIIKEIDLMHKDITGKIIQLSSFIDNSYKSLKAHFQSDITTCVDKLKTVNKEYISQVRKMNDYGTQQITNISDHYTESDGKNNQIKGLSDMKDKENSLYMSDNKETKETKEKDNKYKITYDCKNGKLDKKDQHQQVSELNKVVNELEKNNPKKELSEKIIDNNTESSSDSSKDSKNNLKENNLKENNTKKTNLKETNTKETNTEENNTKETNTEENNTKETDTEENNSDGVSMDIDMKLANIKNQQSGGNSSESSSESSDESEDEITLTKSKKNIKNSKLNEEIVSLATNEVDELTLKTLKDVSTYTIDSLKKIAKQLSIPITNKEGKNRKYFKKNELYEKIKSHLTSKNKI
jgi:hypothetical protein